MRLYVISLFTGLISYGQADNFTVNDPLNFDTNTSGTWVTSESGEAVQGSSYLFENWITNSVLITKENKNYAIKGLNYDTENDTFVARVSSDSLYVFTNSYIKEVKINNKRFKWYKNIDNGNGCNLEVLASAKDVEILKMNRKKIIKGTLNPLTQVKAPDRYTDNPRYFFRTENGIKEIKLKKKSFCKLFGDQSKKINEYLSNNNISVRDEKKLQTVLNYYNTL